MERRGKVGVMVCVMLLLLSPVMVFCAGTQEAKDASAPVEIKVLSPYVGTHSAAEFFDWALKEFSDTHQGTIKVNVEEVPGEQNYVDKIKVLLSTDKLPDVVFSSYNLLDLCVEAGKTVDLTPYLDADPVWNSGFDPATLAYNTFDNKVMGVAYFKRLIGYYYNKELFQKAGIKKPAETWSEFFQQLDMLKNAGITPLSLDTGDSGWITSLWLSSLVGTSGKVGNDFMNRQQPVNYEFPEFIKSVASIQKFFQNYTTGDAVGGKYENGAVNFFSGRTAIIANGTWMVKDFSDPNKAPEGFADKVGIAIYPEGGVFMSAAKGAFCCSKTKSKADAAVEFLKFLTKPETQQHYFELTGESPESPKVEMTDVIKEKYPLVADLFRLSKDAKYFYQYPQAAWYANVTDQLSVLYPLLANGSLSPEDFARKLTETAKNN
ncbi:ABC transporter substrate-binding protein [Sediminispirochaeta smaragdinae]|jgi:raffinose/stachyose/melibiose transport system substrate-binding protein|uniref:Extracellular solute-binding protein family 1 n=1 Tax=Sediminispirochaeta smaragdinae (strain DSM 11293 / JCM 15392 / SEBR 4228) TaxID=573413 RepID=E1R1Z4_SEDSS|nr:extracellular solute-binding protein [Sediminispirochaeta smaragdinae]ADK81520.1 extracellular solute-binding protein family 1 [Sediminispirochaeta smaragdinae DSM 11293]